MPKYYVMRPERDLYGAIHYSRYTMRAYVLGTAKRIADTVDGYVCKLGTTAPVYVAGGIHA